MYPNIFSDHDVNNVVHCCTLVLMAAILETKVEALKLYICFFIVLLWVCSKLYNCDNLTPIQLEFKNNTIFDIGDNILSFHMTILDICQKKSNISTRHRKLKKPKSYSERADQGLQEKSY